MITEYCPDLLALKGLWKRSFGDPDWFIEAFFDTVYSTERCLYLTEDSRLAAVLHWMDCTCRGQKLAYIYAVATEEAFRGRGLCRKLMKKAHEKLYQLGYAGCILVPGSEELRQMYRKMGYETCTSVSEILCKPQDMGLALKGLTTEEYAQRRRELLPQGSVLQEGVQLHFLDMQAKLCAGEDFLAAVSLYDGKLHCTELLGNSDAAPGIVAALGAREGFFRMPGTGKPFAMYHPLRDFEAPEYFGLAFD